MKYCVVVDFYFVEEMHVEKEVFNLLFFYRALLLELVLEVTWCMVDYPFRISRLHKNGV